MRRGILVFALTCIAILLYSLHGVWTLLTLLSHDAHEDAILPSELIDNLEANGHRPQLIPKIIHQTYKNTSVPEVWQDAKQSCTELHLDWEYMFWSDDASERFIALRYPWFLKTFLGYRYDIQRADAIRYFALDYYGGIYIDLDDGCNRSLEPLLQYPAWVRKTTPTGISNDVMGAVPGHPFFKRVISKLKQYDRPWLLLPYATVMGSTGPLFLSLMWRHWSDDGLNTDAGQVRILFQDDYMGQPTSFFTRHAGSSWHQYDVEVWFWLLKHWILVTVICTVVGLGLIFCAWLVYSQVVIRRDHELYVPRRARAPGVIWRQSKRSDQGQIDRHDV